MQKTEFTDVVIFVVASASRMQSLVTKINSRIQTKVILKVQDAKRVVIIFDLTTA